MPQVEQVETAVTEPVETQGAPDTTEQDAREPLAESSSISSHAATFDPRKPDPDAPAGETAEEKAERLHHSAQQRREKETGKFTQGKVRHRAKSQQASAEDVPRI